MSRVAQRGIQPFNAIYDTRGVREDVEYQQQSSGRGTSRKRTYYDSPVVPKDRSIIAGEVVFTKAKAWVPGTADDPEVRSCLNGLTYLAKGAGGKADIRKSIRPVGIALKTVVYDTVNTNMGPSDQPVLAVSGHLTVVNTGQFPIQMGNAMQNALPDHTVLNQYDDKVNIPSANRAVPAYEPLKMRHTFAAEYKENGALEKAFNAAFDKIAAKADPADRAKVKQALQDMLKTAMESPDPMNQLLMDAMLANARAAIMYQLRRYVCTSLTGAEMGHKIKVNVQPLTNLVSRAYDEDLIKV